MIKDLEKGIGHLLGHQEPETVAREKAYYRELIRQKVEGPGSVLNAPVPNVTVLPNVIDITKYNGPPTTAHGQKKLEQRKELVKERKDELKKEKENIRYLAKRADKDNPLSLKFPYNKTTGRFENKEGDRVDPRRSVKEQQFLDQRIEGAKTLQYVSDHNTMYADQPKAYWQWDGVKEDFVDINKDKERINFLTKTVHDEADHKLSEKEKADLVKINQDLKKGAYKKKPILQQLRDLSNWDKENRRQRNMNEGPRKQNNNQTIKERNVR